MSAQYRMQVVDDLATVGRERWTALVTADADAGVLLSYDYLHALHASGSAQPDTGWAPQYLLLWDGETLCAALPLYAKGHSYGEYVFDWAWAEAYQRAGLAYYPKWLAAVPFTPVGGSRLIARDESARAALADALLARVQDSGLSSLHVLFAPRAQADLLAARGLMLREGVQFHWRNAGAGGYADFDAFLAQLAQPKRKKIRAERRKVAEAGVTLTRKTGTAITDDDWRFFFRCYQNTYAQHWSTPYLNLAFFRQLGATLADHVLLVLAQRDGAPVAASLGLIDRLPGGTRLYGRYWGALADVPCLHFEACYYQMIEFAIAQRIDVFEGGAQGVHKLARGLDPVPTWSAHWVADPRMRTAIDRFVTRERDQMEHTIDELNEHRAFKTLTTDR